MKTKEIIKLREMLLASRDELLLMEQLGEDSTRPVELDQSRVGRVSRMDAMQLQAMSQEAKRRRQLELRQVIAALARIESDDYGYCVECGDDIDLRRLQVDPAAPMCISCATAAEQGQT